MELARDRGVNLRRTAFFVQEARHMPRWVMACGGLVHLAVLAILFDAGFPAWRIAAVAGLFLAFTGLQMVVRRKAIDASCVETTLLAVNVGAQLFVVGSATLTGGVHSPFLPSIVLPAIVSLLVFGPIPASRWIATANACLVVAMIALPHSITGDPLPDTHYTLAIVLGLGWSLFMLHFMAGRLAIAAGRAGDTLACLAEERVAETEAQLRRLQSVGAKVAHELKNPLAAIKGLCQLVARTPESERTQERLAVVSSEIERMEQILGEYLSFSRPLEDLHAEPIDLAVIARDVRDVLAGRADQAGVTVHVDGSAVPAKGDPRRLKEALINLVSNAIEATPDGGRVQLRVRGSGAGALVEVEDTGRGIAPEDLERLGTSFFTTRPNGTGLGVVLAQGVIAQHGGTLTYTSTVGRGTVARIALPNGAGATPEPAPRAAMVEARA
jgi:signal transduction histidine kinase